ncbi:hypothetical protein, partial [Treponema sp. R6D11]
GSNSGTYKIAFNTSSTPPDNDETNDNNETNDNDGMYNVDNWWSWDDPSATATATHSVAADGVCTITIGGIPQVNNETDGWGRWKAMAAYYYGDIAKAKTSYKYKFEAWTQSGNRTLDVQYYNDNEAEGGQIRLHEEIQLTTVRKTYTIEGLSLPDTLPEPKNDHINLWFLGADKLGTFYVKIISITPLAGFSEVDDGGNIAVTLDSVNANGSTTQTTTQLTLTFSQEITDLSANDITLNGVSNVVKGTLSGSGPTYTLDISGFTSSGTLIVSVAKSGYTISDSPKTASIYFYTPPSVGITIELVDINEWELTEQSVQAFHNEDKTFTLTGIYTSYQWYLDGVSVGTSQSYTLNKPAGVYQLVVVVTNSNGESRSGRCRVTVLN